MGSEVYREDLHLAFITDPNTEYQIELIPDLLDSLGQMLRNFAFLIIGGVYLMIIQVSASHTVSQGSQRSSQTSQRSSRNNLAKFPRNLIEDLWRECFSFNHLIWLVPASLWALQPEILQLTSTWISTWGSTWISTWDSSWKFPLGNFEHSYNNMDRIPAKEITLFVAVFVFLTSVSLIYVVSILIISLRWIFKTVSTFFESNINRVLNLIFNLKFQVEDFYSYPLLILGTVGIPFSICVPTLCGFFAILFSRNDPTKEKHKEATMLLLIGDFVLGVPALILFLKNLPWFPGLQLEIQSIGGVVALLHAYVAIAFHPRPSGFYLRIVPLGVYVFCMFPMHRLVYPLALTHVLILIPSLFSGKNSEFAETTLQKKRQ
eukprot:TRINITY_DN1397_c0_g3_i1.p1 TRINITY_DN1397_c0_g3~~TRINITY_DN1397_c0_g3_i1.p1  ORF type:complete len:376 (+),score=114.34 TRINITY_DN1397_c0_g3_i1:764-1891(+)